MSVEAPIIKLGADGVPVTTIQPNDTEYLVHYLIVTT